MRRNTYLTKRYISSAHGRRGLGYGARVEALPLDEALGLAIQALYESARGDKEKLLAVVILEAQAVSQPLPEGLTLRQALVWANGALTRKTEEPGADPKWEAAKKALDFLVFVA